MKEELAIVQNLYNVVAEFLVNYSFQVTGAIIIFVIGIFIARWVSNMVVKLCRQRDLDVTLSTFLGSLTKILVLVFVVIITLGKFGLSIAPFIAAIGALALVPVLPSRALCPTTGPV